MALTNAEDRRAAAWAEWSFWTPVLACVLPLAVLGTLTALGAGVCSAAARSGYCGQWPVGPPGVDRLSRVATALAFAALPTAAAASALRRVRVTAAWQALLRVASVEIANPAVLRCIEQAGLAGRVVLVGHCGVGAWTVGLRRPRVVLTTGLVSRLGPDELRAVLLHERFHLRRRDPLRALVVGALADAFGWVPAVGASARHYLIIRELAADRAAVQEAGRPAVASALLRCAESREASGAGSAPAFTDLCELRLRALAGTTSAGPPTHAWRSWVETVGAATAAWVLGAGVCVVLR